MFLRRFRKYLGWQNCVALLLVRFVFPANGGATLRTYLRKLQIELGHLILQEQSKKHLSDRSFIK